MSSTSLTPGAIVVAHVKRGDFDLADPVALADVEFVKFQGERKGAFAGERCRKDALVPGANARRSGNRQRSRTLGNKLRVEHEEWNPAEVIGMEVREQDEIYRGAVDAKPLHGDQRGRAAIDQEPAALGCHMEARI